MAREGWLCTVDGSQSTADNSGAQPLTYLWDLDDDGVFGETGFGASRGYELEASTSFLAFGLGGSSTHTIHLKVIDADGLSDIASTTVNVVNVAPTVYLEPEASIEVGQPTAWQGSFYDPGGEVESFTCTVDYGDGSDPVSISADPDLPFDLVHAYAHPGEYTLRVTVADGEGALGDSTMDVTVLERSLYFDGLASASIVYGEPLVTLGGRVTGGSVIPSGSVSIQLASQRQTVPIDPLDGTFSAVFNTTHLGASESPYVVSYDFADQMGSVALHDHSQVVIVARRPLTVAADSASKVYGQSDPAFTALITGFAPGESASALEGALLLVSSAPDTQFAPVGTYTITPTGLFSANYDISFLPATLTVTQATTAAASLNARRITFGAKSEKVNGQITSNSILPVGHTVSISVKKSETEVLSASGTIDSDGRFSILLPTAELKGGAYTIHLEYAGDANYSGCANTGSLLVTYRVGLLNNPFVFLRRGELLPITIRVADAAGRSVADPDLAVRAVSLTALSRRSHPIDSTTDPASPSLVYQQTSQAYYGSLSTTGLRAGLYALHVTVGDDPVLHPVFFVLL